MTPSLHGRNGFVCLNPSSTTTEKGLYVLQEEHLKFSGIQKRVTELQLGLIPFNQSILHLAHLLLLPILLQSEAVLHTYFRVIHLNANILKMLQETCRATVRKEKAQKPTEAENKKPQVSLFPIKTNNVLCKEELSEPEREIQTKPQNTRKQVTPHFFFFF